MRIAQIVSGQRMNGAVRHCLELSERLAMRGHDVLLIHRPQIQVPDTGIMRLRSLPCAMSHDLPGLREVDAALTAERVEVIHSHMSDAHAFGVIEGLRRAIPCVATAHSRHIQPHWRLNARVICPSARTADFHRRFNFVPARKISVIPNFVDVERISPPSPARRAEMRERLGIPQGGLVVGTLGEIVGYKRQSELVKAFAPIARSSPDARLVMVGAPADDRELARIRKALAAHDLESHVLLLGYRTDARDLLAAFDIYAMSSRSEEMPIAVLEAMASGLPVIGTDVGGMPDLVRTGETGALVRPGDVVELAEHLLDLAFDPHLRGKYGMAGRDRAVAEFAPGPIVDRIEEVLRQATQGDTPPPSRSPFAHVN